MSPEVEDIAAMRADGDLLDYVRSLTGRPPKQRQAEAKPEPKPCFHIRRPGAWPCGTTATGPTPQPCNDCQPKEGTST